jgi:hypothetical protein
MGFKETCWAMVNSFQSGLDTELTGVDLLGDSVVLAGDALTDVKGGCLLLGCSAGVIAPAAASA